MPAIKYVYMQKFHVFGVSVIEILEFNRKMKNMAKLRNTIITASITPVLQYFADLFSILLVQDDLHFGVGRSLIEWNMKVKIGISICTGLMLNDHSNPYVESTTVLSDTAPSA